jgi:hypothetical protein
MIDRICIDEVAERRKIARIRKTMNHPMAL